MPAPRSANRFALLVALAVVAAPRSAGGQSIAGLQIDRAFFLVATKGPDKKWTVRAADRVPLSPKSACYGWRLHFSQNALGDVAWRGELTLAAEPGKAPTVLVTKKREKPEHGWVGDAWCVNKGDPTGEHVIRVYVQDSLAKSFTFSVVAPESLVAPVPAEEGHDRAVVDPLGMLGDFSGRDEALENELQAKYPKPPKVLGTDPAQSSVLLLDIDLKGALKRVDGAAVVSLDGSGGPIRAAALSGSVVMFHTLEPGTYSLRFVRVENYNPPEIIVVERPPSIDINVTVGRGGLYYLGTVVVSRKARLTGLKPPEFDLTYDAKRELEAWSTFKEKQGEGPWAGLVEKRIVALRSP